MSPENSANIDLEMTPPDRELRARWLKALRSGKYQQGSGCLRNNNKFCCLGVLADLISPDGWKTGLMGQFMTKEGAEVYLPPTVISSEDQNKLADRNDGARKCGKDERLDFAEIADYIEFADIKVFAPKPGAP